jgi:hypothetical protein
MERRTVCSEDPSLSPHANDVLTEELRRVVGADVVEVPATRRHEENREHGGHGEEMVALFDNRLSAIMGAFALLVFGGVLTLITRSWWFLGIAFGLDLIGVVVTAAFVVKMTDETEHLSPEATALLENEGVEDPDAFFNQLVDEFATPVGDGRRPGSPRPA